MATWRLRSDCFDHGMAFPTPKSGRRPTVEEGSAAATELNRSTSVTREQWHEIAARVLSWDAAAADTVFDLCWSLTWDGTGPSTGIASARLAAFVILQTYSPKLRAQPSKRLWNVDISWPSPEVFAAQTGLAGLPGSSANATGSPGGPTDPPPSPHSAAPSTAAPSASDVAAADFESERRSRARWARAALARAVAASPSGESALRLVAAFEDLVLAQCRPARQSRSFESDAAADASAPMAAPHLAEALGLPSADPAAAAKLVHATLAADGGSSHRVLPLAMGGEGYVTSSSPRKRAAQPSIPLPSPSSGGVGATRESLSHPVPGLPVHPPSSPSGGGSATGFSSFGSPATPSSASSSSSSSSAAVATAPETASAPAPAVASAPAGKAGSQSSLPSSSSSFSSSPASSAAAPADVAPVTPVGKGRAPATTPEPPRAHLILRPALSASPSSSPRGLDAESDGDAPLGVLHVRKGSIVHADVDASAPGTDDATATSSSSSSAAAAAAAASPRSVHSLRDLTVEGCADAFIYILRPFRHAAVRACSNTTVVVGAAAGVLTVDLCEGCHVIGAARQVRIGNSVATTASVYSVRPPLVYGDCRDVRIGPHCAPFRAMQATLRGAGLLEAGHDKTPDSGMWAQFAVLGRPEAAAAPTTGSVAAASSPAAGGPAGASGPDDAKAAATNPARAVTPAEFNLMVVPAPAGLAGAEDQAVPVPGPMAEATRAARDRVAAVRADIRAAGLPADRQVTLQSCVEGAFKQWLVASGNIRQVADLVRMQARASSVGEAVQSPGGTQRVIMGVMSPSVHFSSPAGGASANGVGTAETRSF